MIDELKNYLDITWDDDAINNKLSGILQRAENILKGYAGTDIDYTSDYTAKQLLFDCCRYIWNNAYEDFKVNYSGDLINLRAFYAVQKS